MLPLPIYENNQVNLKIDKCILFIIKGKLTPQAWNIQALLDQGENFPGGVQVFISRPQKAMPKLSSTS